MMALLSKDLSAIKPPRLRPSNERTVAADDHDHLKGSLVDRSFTISA
jgi:hypothetical protein